MNQRKYLAIFVMIFGCVTAQSENQLRAELGWNIGQTSPDFQASYLSSGIETPVNWYDELGSGADFYVISTCAMWCTPCQQFASDSQSIVDALALQGIQVEIYDWIFEDTTFQDPDAFDAQSWIDALWTADPENVWFGGDIPVSASNSVIEDIFTTHSEFGVVGIPNILILDENLVVRGQFEGYSPGSIENAIQNFASQSVPEPASTGTFACLVIGWMSIRRRTLQVQ